MPTIVLHKPWTLRSSGLVKNPGTRITFAPGADEMKAIIDEDAGSLLMDLPGELPGREHFIKAGFDSLQSLAGLESWDQVKGIGPKTADELDQYFTKINEEE